MVQFSFRQHPGLIVAQERVNKASALIELGAVNVGQIVEGRVNGRGVESGGKIDGRDVRLEEGLMVGAGAFSQVVKSGKMGRVAQRTDPHLPVQAKGVPHQPARRLPLLVLHDCCYISAPPGHVGREHQADPLDPV